MSSTQNISNRAIQLGRAVDRALKHQGNYTIRIIVPEFKKSPWTAEITDERGQSQQLTLTRQPSE